MVQVEGITPKVTGPYFVGRDPPPAPATSIKPVRTLPERTATAVVIPPLKSKSKPHFTKCSIPAVSR
ncbi:MAG: hypothetical protein AAB441_05215 [Patescibacteria group bacterium]